MAEGLVFVLVLASSFSLAPTAVADRSGRAFPSREEVEAAETEVAAKTRGVGAIQASLLLANQRLEQAAVEAEMASEAYHGAMWRLRLAKEEVGRAQAEAATALRTVREQRDEIAALVARSYRDGVELTALSAMVGATGPGAVLDQYAGFQGASEAMQADLDRFAAADALARVFEREARQARAEQRRLALEARGAKDRAAQAATAAQTATIQIAEEKDRLIHELARAQNISVELARERQSALEEIARQRAVERKRLEAQAAARAQARKEAAEARVRAVARREAQQAARAAARQAARRDRNQRAEADAGLREQQKDRPDPAPAPTPAPAPPSTPPAPPSGSGGADRAIAFAQAQLGEPYAWGAAGPDSWDCSGLMLAAWGAAGVYLPHYSAAQYYSGTPISSGDLRAGDLVFWGSTSDPDSIHHVAMYLGGGQIIHAPRTGRPVSIDSIYYWRPPNFFARV